jgi:hypothetical protein
MKLSDFIMLNEEGKKKAVLNSGVLIAKRKDASCIFFLFQMNGFYAETSFDLHRKAAREFRMFHNPELLGPYLEEIAIDELLN